MAETPQVHAKLPQLPQAGFAKARGVNTSSHSPGLACQQTYLKHFLTSLWERQPAYPELATTLTDKHLWLGTVSKSGPSPELWVTVPGSVCLPPIQPVWEGLKEMLRKVHT